MKICCITSSVQCFTYIRSLPSAVSALLALMSIVHTAASDTFLKHRSDHVIPILVPGPTLSKTLAHGSLSDFISYHSPPYSLWQHSPNTKHIPISGCLYLVLFSWKTASPDVCRIYSFTSFKSVLKSHLLKESLSGNPDSTPYHSSFYKSTLFIFLFYTHHSLTIQDTFVNLCSYCLLVFPMLLFSSISLH